MYLTRMTCKKSLFTNPETDITAKDNSCLVSQKEVFQESLLVRAKSNLNISDNPFHGVCVQLKSFPLSMSRWKQTLIKFGWCDVFTLWMKLVLYIKKQECTIVFSSSISGSWGHHTSTGSCAGHLPLQTCSRKRAEKQTQSH